MKSDKFKFHSPHSDLSCRVCVIKVSAHNRNVRIIYKNKSSVQIVFELRARYESSVNKGMGSLFFSCSNYVYNQAIKLCVA